MLVMPDVDDPFIPLPDDLLVNLSESKAVVKTLLESLRTQFAEHSNVGCALGPALQVKRVLA